MKGHAAAGGTSVCLVFARTDTGRVTFLHPLTGAPRLDRKGRPQSAPAPSVAIVYRPGLRQAWPANGVLR